ncbi:protein spinster homolog 1-like isoform X3 [Haliotis rufescens]|uniref:protein spinster homolog 1-like isoform X3 n=1 Tax=Haliotis rufescens TaxID=6454 RepID=UPI00201F2D1A|nr:protein spinster homolog 1-like isoform X3 [Haliotis rufescens]
MSDKSSDVILGITNPVYDTSNETVPESPPEDKELKFQLLSNQNSHYELAKTNENVNICNDLVHLTESTSACGADSPAQNASPEAWGLTDSADTPRETPSHGNNAFISPSSHGETVLPNMSLQDTFNNHDNTFTITNRMVSRSNLQNGSVKEEGKGMFCVSMVTGDSTNGERGTNFRENVTGMSKGTDDITNRDQENIHLPTGTNGAKLADENWSILCHSNDIGYLPSQRNASPDGQSVDLGDGLGGFQLQDPTSHKPSNGTEINAIIKIKSDTAPIVENEENGHAVANVPDTEAVQPSGSGISRVTSYITVATLLVINLLNYMDRYTVSGVLLPLQDFYGIGNSQAGLIQTSFICTYMIFSPIFGYLGDRYTRKYIMAFGIFMWSVFTLSASFIGKDSFYAFVLLRALVGIGEASYSTIAPTIIADLFSKGMRTKMLMVFYFAIPVGSGLGYIVGSYVAKAMHNWQWALRVTPGLGALCVVLILIFCKEPPRGHSEGGTHLVNTSFLQDIKALLKNTSFMFSTGGFTCVAFVTGALAFWAPTYMVDSIESQSQTVDMSQVAQIFGVITVAAGFIGVALGAETARRYKKINPRSDPLICALGLLSSAPFLFFALVLANYSTPATWVLIFLGETMLCMNWAIVTDILLYVVIPTRRSTAEAFQILVSHALGDAGSPYLVGMVSDSLSTRFHGDPKSPSVQFVSLQYALYSTAFVCVLGGGFFLATALFVEEDKGKADRQIRGSVDSSFDDVEEVDEVQIESGGSKS